MSYHVFDKILKLYGETFINILLDELEFDEVIEETYPIEFIDKCKNYKVDFVGLSNKDRVINIEFQSTHVNNQDVIRFMKYAIILKEKYDKETITLDKLTEKFVKDKKLKRKIMEEIGISMSYFEKRCYEIEEEFVNKGIEQGRKETMVEYAKSMLNKNFTKDEIMDIIGISEEELSSLLKS